MRETEARAKAVYLYRLHGVSDATYYRRKSRYAVLMVTELSWDGQSACSVI